MLIGAGIDIGGMVGLMLPVGITVLAYPANWL
jgi:hypothetical protein